MTGRQRCLAMLQGHAVDFVPRVPILMQLAAECIGSNYGAFASDHRVLAEANFRCAADFGMDQLSGISASQPQTIRHAVRQTQGQVGNPFLVNTGCEILAGTPLANL